MRRKTRDLFINSAGRRGILLFLCISFFMIAAGCGDKEKAEAPEPPAYTAEYLELDTQGEEPEQVTVSGSTLFYLTGKYDDAGAVLGKYLCSLTIGDASPSSYELKPGQGSIVTHLCAAPDGSLTALAFTWPDGVTEPASPDAPVSPDTSAFEKASAFQKATAFQKAELLLLSPDGSIVSSLDITGPLAEENTSAIRDMETDKDGNIYLSSEKSILVLGKDGRKLLAEEFDHYLGNLFRAKDGTVMIVSYEAGGVEIKPVDAASGKIGDSLGNINTEKKGDYTVEKGHDTDLLIHAGDSLYSYNFGDDRPQKLLALLDCNITPDSLRSFAALDDGRLLSVCSRNGTELVLLSPGSEAGGAEQKVITLGTTFVSDALREQVVAFNKSHPEYRIKVKEYPDSQEGRMKLNADIAGGNCPDIIDLNSLSLEQYGSEEILEDLYAYLDNDPELSRDDYLENVLKAFEIDGKLYGIPQRFYISTVAAKASDVGNRKSISPDELMEMVAAKPEGTELYDHVTRSNLLRQCLAQNFDRFVDWSTGECSLDGEEFIKLLEFANIFPGEEDTSADTSEATPTTLEKIREGKLLMIYHPVGSTQDYQRISALFGEPFVFIGLPTYMDNGSVICDGGGVRCGISAQSKLKDGAWQFIRIGILPEAQSVEEFGFPILKSALEEQFQQDMTKKYVEDALGQSVEEPKWISSFDGMTLELYAPEQEDIDAVKALIADAHTLYKYHLNILDIVAEEAEAYFQGQKTAGEVAEIIQSRVNIFVGENRLDG